MQGRLNCTLSNRIWKYLSLALFYLLDSIYFSVTLLVSRLLRYLLENGRFTYTFKYTLTNSESLLFILLTTLFSKMLLDTIY